MNNKNEELYNGVMTEGQEFIDNVIFKKYCIKDYEEKNYNDVQKRLMSVLPKNLKAHIRHSIDDMITRGRFVPAGSVSFGCGNTTINCSLSNCYFTPIKEDSIEGIFDCIKEMAKTFSYRGGSGTDITILRPKGTKVHNAAITSTGAVSFMPLFSNTAYTIGQNGRRGAELITIDVRHPETIDFAMSKAYPESVFIKDLMTGKIPDINDANISIKVTDEFMRCVVEDKDWTFIFPDTACSEYSEWNGDYDVWIGKGYPIIEYETMKARDILNTIAKCAWKDGCPGLVFMDTIIDMTPGSFDPKLKPRGLNPCGEQPLADYNNCLLGALVLHKYVSNPYTDDAYFNFKLFIEDVEDGIRYLNILSDINNDAHPLKEQRDGDKYGKRVGQEFTGLTDMLAMLGLKYTDPLALKFVDKLLRLKAIKEFETSITLAKEIEPAPCLKDKSARKKFLETKYVSRLLDNVKYDQDVDPLLDNLVYPDVELIKKNALKHGLRNSAWNTVGPVGTISIKSDNCTSGIEPLFELEYQRETRLNPGVKTRIFHYPLLKHIGPKLFDMEKKEILEKYNYVEAHNISFEDRIAMQSVVQKYTDSSVSSTANLPNNVAVDDVVKLYILSWQKKLKGITVFRDGSKHSVLTSIDSDESETNDEDYKDIVSKHLEEVRLELMTQHKSVRFVQYWKKIKIYISVTLDENEQPIEIFATVPYEAGFDVNGNFINHVYMERVSTWSTICRLCSLCLRAGVSVDNVKKQLEKSCTVMTDLPAILLRILNKFNTTDAEICEQIESSGEGGEKCLSCGKNGVAYRGGCKICLLCGDEKCS